jgi:uncharacterized phiE125 gp8 family phage protein
MSSPLARLKKRELAGRIVALERSTEPDNSPLLSVAKENLRIETTAQDALLQRLINAAVRYVEMISRKSLLDQGRRLTLDNFPAEEFVQLYAPPVKAVTSFTTYDENDVPDATFADYTLDLRGSRILLKYGFQWPVNLRSASAVVIVYTTGHGTTAAALPQTLLEAVLMLVAHWYQNPSAVGCDVGPELAHSVEALIGIERDWRL